MQKPILIKIKPWKTGQYHVLMNLGIGGQGSVFICEKNQQRSIAKIFVNQLSLERQVTAYKKLNQREQELFCRMIQHDRQMIVTYNSRDLPKEYISGQKYTQFKLPVLVLELVKGLSLQLFFANTKCQKFSLGLAAHILKQIIKAINLLIFHNISHHDIKSANIILLLNGGIKLIDFGVCTHINDYSSKCGTLTYQPPQVIKSKEFQPIQIDVYSAHIVFYKMITKSKPFPSSSYQKKEATRCKSLQKVLVNLYPQNRQLWEYMKKNLSQNIKERDSLYTLYSCLVMPRGMETISFFQSLRDFNINQIKDEVIQHYSQIYDPKSILNHILQAQIIEQIKSRRHPYLNALEIPF